MTWMPSSSTKSRRTADGTVTVIVTPTYQAGSIQHSIGYIISGTTKDGVYLVVQDENLDRPYFLNVPPGRDPGYCDVADHAERLQEAALHRWHG